MNLLEVKNLSKTYGSGEAAVHALKGVSFRVPKGEYVAVVGESGSGKSTLLNLIGALDTPTSGKVWIDGRDIFSMKERSLTVFRRRNIGFIFQSFNLIPELTVEQNIIFPLLLDYRAAECSESEGTPPSSARSALRRPAAACGDWAGADHTSGADPGRRTHGKSGHAEYQRGRFPLKGSLKAL